MSHLLVNVELPENLSGVKEMGVVDDSEHLLVLLLRFRALKAVSILLGIVPKQRQVENEGKPVSVDQEQEGKESVNSDFGDDIRVEAVAKIDRVDVVAARTIQVSIPVFTKRERRQQACDVGRSRRFVATACAIACDT